MATNLTPIAMIGNDESFLLDSRWTSMPSSEFPRNNKVLIRMDSYNNEIFEGTISKIYPVINERSQSFTVEATFNDPQDVLYPFLTAEGFSQKSVFFQREINIFPIHSSFNSVTRQLKSSPEIHTFVYLLKGCLVVQRTAVTRTRAEIIPNRKVADVFYAPDLDNTSVGKRLLSLRKMFSYAPGNKDLCHEHRPAINF